MKPYNISDVLLKARDILNDPKAWCKGTFARDKNEKKASPYDPDACQFCATGAILKAESEYDLSSANGLYAEEIIEQQLPCTRKFGGIPSYNDALVRTHEEILALFDRAIVAASQLK